MTAVHDLDARVAPADAADVRVLYVLKRYPRLSETFIVRELLGLEAAGARIGIDALLEPEPGAHHPDVADVRASVRYLPRRPKWSREVLRAHTAAAARHPVEWIRRATRARHLGEWRRFLQAGLVADRARRGGFRHIHAHFATAAADVARDAAALAGITFSVTAHAKDIFHVDNADRLASRLAGAAAVVTVSDYNVRHLRDELGHPNVHHVPNGLPIPEQIGPTPEGPVLCVARLVPKKGIDVLLHAVARTRSECEVEIVGDGPCRADLESLTRQLDLTERVRFRGAVDSTEVAAAYRRAAVVALPCRIDPDGDRDGMPTVLVEAMARGLPVISTDVVGLDELVTSGHDGLLVAPDDASALARAIDEVLDDPALAATMGERARDRVMAEFAPALATAALLNVFRTAGDERCE